MIRVRRRSLRPAIFRHGSGRPKSTAIFIANKSLPLCVGWFDANTEINQRGHVTAGAPLALIMTIYVICFTVELESSLINRVNKYEIARKLRKPGPQRNQFIRVYSVLSLQQQLHVYDFILYYRDNTNWINPLMPTAAI